jgi:hypothetical protein
MRPLTSQSNSGQSIGMVEISPAQGAYYRWLDNPRQDIWLSGVLLVVLCIISHFTAQTNSPLGGASFDSKHTLFQVTVGSSVTLLGLILTSISVLVNLLRAPLGIVDRVLSTESKSRIAFSFIDCLWAIGLLLVASTLGLLHDGGQQATLDWVEIVFSYAAIFATLRFVRIVGLLRLLLPIAS